MSEYLLEMKHITKSFSGVHALDDVNFAVRPGKVLCIAGENGCGKSTLVKIISGVYTKDDGEVWFEGKEIIRITPAEATHLGIQVIYQDLSIFPNLTIRENLALNSEISANSKLVNRKRMEKTAKEALSKIGHKIDLDAKMGDLSIADKQLIAICRALLFNAKLIIMDEPTTALTKKEVDALFRTIRMLRDRGIAIMFISHKIDEIFEIADDVAIMRNGKNVYLGTTADITPQKFMFYMTGREITDKHFVPKNISRDPILEIKNLSQEGKYKDVSFKLRKGEILGITGLLGSGRTELALSLFGINKPTSGDVFLNGNKVKISSPIMAQKLHIGYVPEDRLTEGLCLRQPIANNITLASLKRLSNRFGLIKQEDILKEANKWVKKFSIATDNALKAASTLSGGNQQKIVLSKWLSNDLDILILNGPTVGVDVGAKQDIHNLLHELANQGLAVIIISDDLAEVIVNCNRVIVMKEGRIVGQMKDEEITDQAVRAIIQ
jgi:simple sugar transport system ATP-binding protein